MVLINDVNLLSGLYSWNLHIDCIQWTSCLSLRGLYLVHTVLKAEIYRSSGILTDLNMKVTNFIMYLDFYNNIVCLMIYIKLELLDSHLLLCLHKSLVFSLLDSIFYTSDADILLICFPGLGAMILKGGRWPAFSIVDFYCYGAVTYRDSRKGEFSIEIKHGDIILHNNFTKSDKNWLLLFS